MTTTVADNPEKSRYEVRVDGELAGFTGYRLRDGVAVLTHTEIDPAFQGHGLATTLTKQELDDLRRRGLLVKPYCPFVRDYIAEHPSYLDLVPEADRERFGLAGSSAG